MIPANIHAVDITWNAPVFSDNTGLDIKVRNIVSDIRTLDFLIVFRLGKITGTFMISN
jgi:hypothetical protein